MTYPSHSILLPGLEPFAESPAEVEALRVLLSYRGEVYSLAYLQGISGAAFRVGGWHPGGPGGRAAAPLQQVARTLGYAVTSPLAPGEAVRSAWELERVLQRVKDELQRGRPFLAWDVFGRGGWDVVCGYDDDRGLFYGRCAAISAPDYVSAPQTRWLAAANGNDQTEPVVLLIGEREDEYDAPAAERAVLQAAIRHARARRDPPDVAESWAALEGVQAYERWVSEFREDPAHARTSADAYGVGVMRQAHAAAAPFLDELVASFPAAGNALRRAAGCFAAEAEALASGECLLGPMAPRTPDRRRNAALADLLAHASDAYATGISALEKALPCVERAGRAPNLAGAR